MLKYFITSLLTVSTIFILQARELSIVDFPNPIKTEISDLGFWEVNSNEYIANNISISSLFLNQLNTNKSYLKLGYKPNSRKEIFAASILGVYKIALKMEQQNVENNFNSMTYSYTKSRGTNQLDYSYAGIFLANKEFGLGYEYYKMDDRFEDSAEYIFTGSLEPDQYTLMLYDYDKLAVTKSKLHMISLSLRASETFSLTGKLGMGKRVFNMDINSFKEYDYIGEFDFSRETCYEKIIQSASGEYSCDQYIYAISAEYKKKANENLDVIQQLKFQIHEFKHHKPAYPDEHYFEKKEYYSFGSEEPFIKYHRKLTYANSEFECSYFANFILSISSKYQLLHSIRAEVIPRIFTVSYPENRDQKIFQFKTAFSVNYKPTNLLRLRAGLGWNYLKEGKNGRLGESLTSLKWKTVTENPEYETLLLGGLTIFPHNKISLDIFSQSSITKDETALEIGLTLAATL